MKRIKSKSDKRVIVEGTINNEKAYFLLDTGASVGLLNSKDKKKYKLNLGIDYRGTLIGAGGNIKSVKHCNDFVNIEHINIPQFLVTNIESIVDSINKETGIRILGIIGLPQMQICGIGIDANSMEIIVE